MRAPDGPGRPGGGVADQVRSGTAPDRDCEGTAKRVTVLRNDRVLVDIPLVAGVAASVVLAIYMPVLSAIVAVGALFAGCTVRIEREEPPEEA